MSAEIFWGQSPKYQSFFSTDAHGNSAGADGNNFAAPNWQQQQTQQQGMMNPMGMPGMGMPGMMPGFNNDMAAQFGAFDGSGMGMGMGMGMFPPPPMPDMNMRETIYLKESTLFPPPPSKYHRKKIWKLKFLN